MTDNRTTELREKLTAEQVREAIERNFGKVAVLDDGKPVEWRDDWVCNVGINYKAIADELNATLGSDRLAFLEEKVKLQGDYIDKLTKEKNALFAQGCEAATRHAGQIDAMQRKLESATLGSGTCHEAMIDRFFRGCSECGYMWEFMYGIGRRERPNYCPNCGRRVIDDRQGD